MAGRKLLQLCAVVAALTATPPALAQAPPNDDFDNATAFASLPFSDTVDTTLATTAADEPFDDCSSFPASSVWYRFTAPETGPVAFSTTGSTYNTAVSVYTGSRDSLVLDSCFGGGAGLQAQAGMTYHIRVSDSFQSGGGTLVFNARRGPTMTSFTIDPIGILDRTAGTATISGTISCSQDATAQLAFNLFQGPGRGGSVPDPLEVPCSPTTSTWTATIITIEGRLVPGRADVNFRGGPCDPEFFTCDPHELDATIRLRMQ